MFLCWSGMDDFEQEIPQDGSESDPPCGIFCFRERDLELVGQGDVEWLVQKYFVFGKFRPRANHIDEAPVTTGPELQSFPAKTSSYSPHYIDSM